MKHIFVIGSQGYERHYGGWETFVKNFCDYYNKKKAKIYVTEVTNVKHQKEYEKNHITCLPVFTNAKGSIRMMIYSIKSLYYVRSYIKKNHLKNSIIYILGLKLGPFLHFLYPSLKRSNIKVFVNPDGLEWKRSKWNTFIKKYFLYAEKTMLKYCDGIVCDSEGIQSYLEEAYPNNHVPKHFIAYGTKKIDLKNVDEAKILNEYHLKQNKYCLVVGRCVPENNFEFIIQEFMNSNIKKDLVIISNIEGSKYYEELVEKTGCSNDSRIHILNGIYDEIKLATIRKNAFLYLHGHSVGGTNPSLLEALSLTDLNLLYDVNFNHQVGLDSCLYFKEENSLRDLLNQEKILEAQKQELGKKAKKRIQEEYTWEYILKKYETLFSKNSK